MNRTINPNSIRAVAHALRSQLGMRDQAVLNFRDILRKLGRVLPKTQVKVVPEKNAPALAWTEAGTLYVQQSVFDRLAHDDVHARYIVAHEIGHIALHHETGWKRGADRPEPYGWRQLEMEAALFASEFLIPTSLVKRFQTVEEAGAKFRPSHHESADKIAELVSADALPLAPATRARADIVNELIDQGYSESEISDLVVPKRTLARRRADNELLTVEETDKALRLSRIAKQATGVFGDATKAHRWLRKPKRALKGETPVAFLASEEGARKVEEMLHRIDHGMAA
jgi:putative toxin-antitoxin system antitoxin component (TIGR02293 family)